MLKRKQFMVLLALLVLVACKDENVRKVARAADDMAQIVSLAIDTKRQLGQTGSKLISNEEELALTQGLVKVNAAVKAFHAQVRTLNKLDDPMAKPQLVELFRSITESVADLNNKGVLGIKNPEARTRVATVLSGFTATFAVIQALL